MKNIILLLLFSINIVSCNSFLDINPKDQIVNEDMFSDNKNSEDAITGIYGTLKRRTVYGEMFNWGTFSLLSQDLGCSSQVTTNYPFTKYDYDNAYSTLKSIWGDMYEIIGYTNNAISELEKNKDFDLINIYKGELYALRAMMHFDLVKSFAPHVEKEPNAQGIPYVTNYNFEHTPFSTVQEVYKKVVEDLKTAQKLLEEDKDNITYPRKNISDIKEDFLKYRQLHLNYYASTALLARVLRMEGKYDEAKIEALKVIDSKKFPLATKDEVQSLVAGVVNDKENIFGLYSKDYFDVVKLRLYDGASWTSLSPYQEESGAHNLLKEWSDIYEKYLGENSGQDARLTWFAYHGEASGSSAMRYFMKFVDINRIESDETASKRGLIEGISMIRIPEMYYIAAEADLRNNDLIGASLHINKVLTSRGLTALKDRQPVLTASLDLLYNERHKELVGEGQRWFDMKKLNMDIVCNETYKTYSASTEDMNKYYVFPIPNEEFDYRFEKK